MVVLKTLKCIVIRTLKCIVIRTAGSHPQDFCVRQSKNYVYFIIDMNVFYHVFAYNRSVEINSQNTWQPGYRADGLGPVGDHNSCHFAEVGSSGTVFRTTANNKSILVIM